MAKKEKRSDADEPDDDAKGDCWDDVALDSEHRLVVSAWVGKHSAEHVDLLVEDFHRRTQGRLMALMTSDENPAYAEAILRCYGAVVRPQGQGQHGRHPQPYRVPPAGLKYATVHKTREKNRVVGVQRRVICGTAAAVEAALAASQVSTAVNTVFVERHNGTDRNACKVRKTSCFSKDWTVHEAVSYFTLYSYNSCWPVQTLRQGSRRQGYRQRTPATAAGLADHMGTLKEWLTRPAVQRR